MSNKLTFKKIFGQAYIWLILLLMYLPILVIIIWSFTKAEVGYWTGNDPFALYRDLFMSKNGKEIWIAVGNTVIVAVTSAVVATVLGTMGAIGAFYSKKRARNTIDLMTQIPLVNAEIVVAFSLTVMFVFIQQKIFVSENEIFSYWTLLIGHVSLAIPFVYTSVKPKLEQMDPSLYEAALDLGCSPRKAMSKVLIPEVMPGVLSGFLLSITLSLDDFIITAFTRGAGLLSGKSQIQTISTFVQEKIKKQELPKELRPLTVFIFLLVVACVIGVTVYQNQVAKKKKVRKGRE